MEEETEQTELRKASSQALVKLETSVGGLRDVAHGNETLADVSGITIAHTLDVRRLAKRFVSHSHCRYPSPLSIR